MIGDQFHFMHVTVGLLAGYSVYRQQHTIATLS